MDDSAVIQGFIDAASGDTLLTIPAGKYLVQTDIQMKSDVVLRGAKTSTAPYLPADDSAATTIILDGCRIMFDGGSRSTRWTPALSAGGDTHGYVINSGYTTGSTSLVLANGSVAAGSLVANDYIAVYQNEDSAWVDDKNRCYLGEDSCRGTPSDPHVWAQYTKITNITGETLTIDPPLYLVTPSPTGQKVRRQVFGITNAGLENMRIDHSVNTYYRLIHFQFCAFCWVKGVETYMSGNDGSGSPHVWMEFCYACELRDGYHHHGINHQSGRSYGLEFYHWNSRHKIENNIVRETRHSIIFEGGGSGCAILYNYTDDNWEAGGTTAHQYDFLSEDQVSNHGAHPYMNLWEGNWGSCQWADYTQGSSSHCTLFRNAYSGKQTSYTLVNPYLWVVIEIETYNRYYNIIGNILGNSTFTGGTVIDDNSPGAKPTIYRFGHESNGGAYTDGLSRSTVILQGNYDFVSDSVHDWDDPDNHTLSDSLYYNSAPSFFTGYTWPPYSYTEPSNNGPLRLPAGVRYSGGSPVSWPPIPIGGTLDTNVIREKALGSQRASSGIKTGDSATLAFPLRLEYGNLVVIAGACYASPAPTAVVVTAPEVQSFTTILGPILESNYRTFIAYGLVTQGTTCTVTVNPQGATSGNAFAWSQDEFIFASNNVAVSAASQSPFSTIQPSGGLAKITFNPTSYSLVVGVMTHGAAPLVLSNGPGFTTIGQNNDNAAGQAYLAEFRIMGLSQVTDVGVNYPSNNSSGNNPYAVQTCAFSSVFPAPYPIEIPPGQGTKPRIREIGPANVEPSYPYILSAYRESYNTPMDLPNESLVTIYESRQLGQPIPDSVFEESLTR